jgi:hypothetical protein
MLARALCAMRPDHLFRFGHAFFRHRYITSDRIHVSQCADLNLRVQCGKYGVMFYLEFSYQLIVDFTENVAGNTHNASRNDLVKSIVVFFLLLIRMAIIMAHEISF